MTSKKPMIIFAVIALGFSISLFMLFGIEKTDILKPSSIQKKIQSELMVMTFQNSDEFTKLTGDGALTFDTTDYVMGKQSLKMSTNGQNGSETIRKTNISPPVDFSGKFLKALLKISNLKNVDKIWIKVTNNDFKTYKVYWIHQYEFDTGTSSIAIYKYFQKNHWSPITISLTQTIDNGLVDLSKINAIEIYVKDNGKGPVTVWFNSLSLLDNNSEGIVTFTFDDASDTQYTNAVPILAKYNFSGTAYVPINHLGKPGKLDLAQIKEMENIYDWDVSSHSINHVDLSDKENEPQLEDEIVKSKQFLIDNGFTKGVDHFAYPFGGLDSDLAMRLIKQNYETARGVRGNTETIPPADDYRLRVMYVKNYTTPNDVFSRVQNAIENGDWLILLFHRIEDSNANHINSKYLKSNFEIIVDYVNSSGIKVMTVSEAYNQFIKKQDDLI